MKCPPAPGTMCPRQPSVLDHVHPMTAQDVWLPHGATPVLAHSRGVSVPTPVAREAEANRECGVIPNPFASSQPPPVSLTRTRGSVRTGPDRARRDSRRAPAYAPRPSRPPTDASAPAYADKSFGSRPHTESQSAPLR